jgi:tight adherence protein B
VICLAEIPTISRALQIVSSAAVFLGIGTTVFLGYRPFMQWVRAREHQYDMVLRRALLMDVSPRSMTVLTGIVTFLLAFAGYVLSGSLIGAGLGIVAGLLLPVGLLRWLRRRRIEKLENQLVAGIQTIASGVRAGLNLVQAMGLIARDGPNPLRQEFTHLLREYEYGMTLEDALNNAASRIGSGDFRLLFSALLTHRERGGDLGQTLDRIADSIREIQRLEGRVKSLTAQGRATARWLGAMPVAVLVIYYLIDSNAVARLFTDDVGKLILLLVVVMTVVGFLWIKKVVSVDI